MEVFRASAEEYISTMFLKCYMEELQHQWSSIESKVESYNGLWRETKEVKFCEDFVTFNPGVAGHFNSKKREEGQLIDDQDQDEEETEAVPVKNTIHELGRKNLTSFYHHEVHDEMVERKEVEEITFGPKEDDTNPGKKISFKQSLEQYMDTINTKRKDELYRHTPEDCSKICRERGCDRVATMDGKFIGEKPILLLNKI